jgi:hypothetical protein
VRECLRRVRDHRELRRFEVPAGERLVQLGDAPAFAALAAELDPLREPDGRFRLLERFAVARAADVLEVGAKLRIGQQAGLAGARFTRAHLGRAALELGARG